MQLESFFPIWDKIEPEQQEKLRKSAVKQIIKKGTILCDGGKDCTGLVLVCKGLLRAYMLSEDGREVTVYRLFDRDICLLCASCVMTNIQFDIFIEAEHDTEAWIIPPWIFKSVQQESLVFSNYMNDLMAMNLSEVMWMVEQVMWKSVDKRLAQFLIEESRVESTLTLKITHEKIANHLGTAREVVTRMLKHFQTEGIVNLRRGEVEITDLNKLKSIQ